MNPASLSLRDRLKAATAADHAALDEAASHWRFDNPKDYAAFLGAQAEVLIPVEKALEAAGIERLLPDWQTRKRSAALLADLTILGEAPDTYIKVSAYAGPAALWGAAYVLEGSRLGARFLLRQVQAGNTASQRATAFLRHGEGERLWQSFLDQLEASEVAHRDPDILVVGARKTFQLFADAFGVSPANDEDTE